MTSGYIHGFSASERDRLVRQAELLAPRVFGGLDFSAERSVLELGCAVGAEMRILLRRYPGLRVAGLDRSPDHLAAARTVLGPWLAEGRAALHEADAAAMPLPDGVFDTVLTIWMLEHVPDPRPILVEAARVLRPGGRLILTEVANDTFGFDPPIPEIAVWWDRFNARQQAAGGDPFVGRHLAEHLEALGFVGVTAEELLVVDSRARPQDRAVELDYLEELLLSGAEELKASASELGALRAGFDQARRDLQAHFQYHAFRTVGRKG